MNETYSIIINGLEFIQDSRGNFHWTGAVRGFGKGDIRTTSHLNSGAPGGYVGDQYPGIRRIPLDLVVQSQDLVQLRQFTRILNDSLVYGKDIEVRLVTPDGHQFVIPRARLAMCEPEIAEVQTLIDYRVEIIAGDPTIYDYTSGEASRIELRKKIMGGIEWTDTGIVWTSSGIVWNDAEGDAIIANLGNVDVYPQVTVNGNVTNPVIRNLTTGRQLSLELSTSASDVIKIDFLNGIVTLNGFGIYNNLIDDDFWPILPGDNIVSYTTSSNEDDAIVELEYYNGYDGVM